MDFCFVNHPFLFHFKNLILQSADPAITHPRLIPFVPFNLHEIINCAPNCENAKSQKEHQVKSGVSINGVMSDLKSSLSALMSISFTDE